MGTSIIPEKRRFVYLLSVSAALILAALGLLTACRGGGTAPSGGSASNEEGATPTATPVPLDPALARHYERNGQYDEATTIYQAIVSRGSDSERQAARLALARVQLAEEQYGPAEDDLRAYISDAGTGDLRQAQFLLAQSLAGLGQDEEALALYRQYIDEGGVAAANAQVEAASTLVSLGRVTEAEQEAEAALSSGGLPDSARTGVILSMAQALEGTDITASITWYERLFAETSSTADKALALWREGSLKQSRGDGDWAVDLQTVVSQYPSEASATDALDALLAAGETVNAYVEGLVDYRHFRNDEALAAFQRYLQENPGGPNAAAAHYYSAATDERLGDEKTAVDEYAASIDLDPTGALADDAMWWEGLLLEKQSRFDEASALYDRLQQMNSTWSEDAGFRQGLVLYRQNRFTEAANAWDSAAKASSSGATKALLWAAKAELAAGDKKAAQAHLAELTQEHPFDYYGLRAAVLLSQSGGGSGAKAAPGEASAGEDAQSWLISVAGGQEVSAWTFSLDPRWAQGQELLAVGLPREASAQFSELMWAQEGNPTALLALARLFSWSGLTEMSSRSAQLILDGLSAEDAARAPRALLQLAYPQDYADLLDATAQKEGVPASVMLALMRQESFFDPLAGSGAGALGLTQVIPSTAKEIAGELGESNFSNDELLQPVVSIEFGAHYLSNQLSAFGDNLYYALAAYNGGPGNVDRWQSAAGGDVDAFLEEIDASQSQMYVKLVMENLAVYRYLYEGEPRPSLPQ
ncbi:MAG: transglycosylase SLT domain-containing protein [Dehalococcoidia bacterium]|jgi:soluble lytic murein transglycosylase